MIYPSGIIPAVPAIFDEKDHLQIQEVKDVISFLKDRKCHGIALNLIGGEFYKLSEHERQEIVRAGIETAGGKMPVYCGISAPGTTEA